VSVTQGAPRDGGRRLRRVGVWLTWGLCGLCVALAVVSLAFGARNYESLAVLLATDGHSVVVAVSFPVVGALIATHRPQNLIGWTFCAVGLAFALVTSAYEYAVYTLQTAPDALPGGPLAIWVNYWAWPLGAGLLLTFVPLLFPDGRLPSRRWRPVAWLSIVLVVTISGLNGVTLWPLRGLTLLHPSDDPPPLAGVLNAAILLLVVCGLASLLALGLRFRRSQGIERQQLKWLVYAAAMTLLVTITTQGFQRWRLGTILLFPLLASVPVAAGIAILRYRLYDIDRLINRTLVYGLLTVLLAVIYAGIVLTLGQLFGGLGDDPPSWVVAGATLAVAALFQPARRRIQQGVDRRFNRRKYNTALTIEAFSARLRDEVDLDTLSTELLAVVDQTMQPTTASLWLRPSAQASPGSGVGGL
jgi:hypothetical protein